MSLVARSLRSRGWHDSGGKGGIFDLGSHAVVLKAAVQDLDPVLVSYVVWFFFFFLLLVCVRLIFQAGNNYV